MSDKSLVLHYRVLKQFLDISDDQNSRMKSSSSRAARAREKLLKLSEAQFKELSTDVYDELKRRIDESRGEPDYLLPKSSFHPKRNQARQKLSSLPQSRFKDLVSDISYEIERRNLHIPPRTNSVGSTTTGSALSHHSYSPTHNRINSVAKTDPIDEEPISTNTREFQPEKEKENEDPLRAANDTGYSTSTDVLNKTIGISNKEIVVTKANLTWSSDDDAESIAETPQLQQKSTLVEEPAAASGAASEQLKSDLEKHKSDLEDLTSNFNKLQADFDALKAEKEKLQTDLNESLTKNVGLDDEISNLSREKDELMVHNRNLEAHKQEYIALTKEYEDLKSSTAALRLENQSLKNSSPQTHTRSNSSYSLKESNGVASGLIGAAGGAAVGLAAGSLASSSTEPNGSRGLNKQKDTSSSQLDVFLRNVSDLDAKPTTSSPTNSELRKESAKWQAKFEDLRAGKISRDISRNIMSNQQLYALVSNQGLVDLKLISKFQSSLESLFDSIDEKNPNVDSLFQMVSKTSILANDVATQSERTKPNNDSAVNVREAASHALTAVRYFVSYSSVLPKVVVERALGELAFAVCDLAGNYKVFRDDASIPGESAPQSADTSRIEEDTSSIGVKPLRMAQKLMGSQSSFDQLKNDNSKSIIPDVSQTETVKPVSGTQPSIAQKSLQKEVVTEPNVTPKQASKPETRESKTSPRAKAINNLASKFENSSPKADSPTKSSPKTTPTRRNILDRVKQFESPSSDEGSPTRKSPGSSPQGESTGHSFLVNRTLSRSKVAESNGDVEAASKISAGAAAGALAGVSAAAVTNNEPKSKGIFQSLRDKLGYDNKAETSEDADQADELNQHDSSNEHILTSTAETTPSKDGVVDDSSFQSPQKSVVTATPSKEASDIQDSFSSEHTISNENGTTGPLNISKQKVKQRNLNEEEPARAPSSKKVTIADVSSNDESDNAAGPEDEKTIQARQRQEYRKSMAAATFNVDLFDIDDPDNTLTQVLLYLEHQTVQVITTIQVLLSAIKKPNATRGDLREKSLAITEVISQMTDATNTSMNQTRNAQLKEHGSWVVKSLEDCYHRMNILCRPTSDKQDSDFADRSFKQRLAGISFDIAKCTKELVKTVEEASLKEDIANLDARLSQADDLT